MLFAFCHAAGSVPVAKNPLRHKQTGVVRAIKTMSKAGLNVRADRPVWSWNGAQGQMKNVSRFKQEVAIMKAAAWACSAFRGCPCPSSLNDSSGAACSVRMLLKIIPHSEPSG